MASGQQERTNEVAEGLQKGLGDALGGLTDALGGVGKTVGGVAEAATGTLQGVLGELLGPLQQLQQRARSGDEGAGKAYDQAVTLIRNSSKEGNQDAQVLLDQLGEALEQTS